MKRHDLTVVILLSVAGCAGFPGAPPPKNPLIASDAMRIGGEAHAFFASLTAKTAPDCGFTANAATYDTLRAEVTTLRARVPAKNGTMATAIDALARTVDGAAHAHDLASRRTDDANGVCLAPAAITLNADAVDRAAGAVLTLERKREGL